MADAEVSQLIRVDAIDILVDLAGHTAGLRLKVFADKPAPVQISYLGYPNTSGMGAMDFDLTDPFADPPDMTDAFFSEALLRLPRTFATYTPPADAPAVAAAPGLAGGHVTFGSFHVVSKINRVVLECWAGILKAVPDARLLLCARGIEQPWNARRMLAAFENLGVEPGRIELAGARPMVDYLRLHERVDIQLDTFPVNGHTVLCHGLWMGVPPVALAGGSHAGRLGTSVLQNIGLAELIAADTGQYIERAAALAGDRARLSDLRASMRERMLRSALMDHAGFARDVEAAYREAWRACCLKR
jgi:predicted O-linked N-acetylglucosamine transferase (SPINDLY family)